MGYSVQSIGKYQTWIPTFTGFSVDPTNVVAQYSVNGNMCHVSLTMTAGTSNATGFTITLPFSAAITTNTLTQLVTDNGTNQTAAGACVVNASSNILNIYKSMTLGGFTASGGKACRLNFMYRIA
jgi:hypothetical protein